MVVRFLFAKPNLEIFSKKAQNSIKWIKLLQKESPARSRDRFCQKERRKFPTEKSGKKTKICSFCFVDISRARSNLKTGQSAAIQLRFKFSLDTKFASLARAEMQKRKPKPNIVILAGIAENTKNQKLALFVSLISRYVRRFLI